MSKNVQKARKCTNMYENVQNVHNVQIVLKRTKPYKNVQKFYVNVQKAQTLELNWLAGFIAPGDGVVVV